MKHLQNHIMPFLLIVALMSPLACLAQQTNNLQVLQDSFQKQEKVLQDGYTKSLETLMEGLKEKGKLDAYLVVETEKKRFSTDAVMTPVSTNEVFYPSVLSCQKSRLSLLKKYSAALDNLIATEMKANRIEEAKAVRAEKGKYDSEIKDLEDNVQKMEYASKKVPLIPTGDPKVKIVNGYPAIDGIWKEDNGIYVWIRQDKEDWLALCGYVGGNVGIVNWDIKGKISKDGALDGRLTHTRAPPNWVHQRRTFKLTDDGCRLVGQAFFDGGGGHGLNYLRITDLTRQDAPKGSAMPSIVGIWRKSDGLFIAYYSDGVAGTPEAKNTTIKWRLKKGDGLGTMVYEVVNGENLVTDTLTVDSRGKVFSAVNLRGEKYTAEKCENNLNIKSSIEQFKKPAAIQKRGIKRIGG